MNYRRGSKQFFLILALFIFYISHLVNLNVCLAGTGCCSYVHTDTLNWTWLQLFPYLILSVNKQNVAVVKRAAPRKKCVRL
jgi:hypothetical protein